MDNLEVTEQKGAHAPKNPQEKGKPLCFLWQTDVEGTKRPDGRFSDEIYLDMGRLKDKIKIGNGITDEALLDKFENAQEFREIVKGIAVSFDESKADSLDIAWQFYGVKDRMGGGDTWKMSCTADGNENYLRVSEQAWGDDNMCPGQMRIYFPEEGMRAKVNVIFYVDQALDVPPFTMDEEIWWDSEEYQQMIQKSLVSTGNNYRLLKVMDKGYREGELTIGFIGGSITQGAGAKPGNTACYSYLAYQGIQAQMPNIKLNYVRAGLGGTPSELGLLRFERDVVRDNAPDIVVIEFAVNDADDETQGRCFEGLVRKALMLPSQPSVFLLFSVFSNDWNLQDRLIPIGQYYNLPMISVLDAVSPQFGLTSQRGRLISKRQYFYDCFHPTNDGHRVMADCVCHVVGSACRKEADPSYEMPEQPLMGSRYEGVRLISRENVDNGKLMINAGGFTEYDHELQTCAMDDGCEEIPQFADNWMWSLDQAQNAESGDSDFVIKGCMRTLFIITKDTGMTDFGNADIYVDGQYKMTIDSRKVGWTHCHPFLIIDDEETREHEVRVVNTDKSKKFTILGVACE